MLASELLDFSERGKTNPPAGWGQRVEVGRANFFVHLQLEGTMDQLPHEEKDLRVGKL